MLKMTHQTPSLEERLVICMGDIHGHYSKLEKLWSNLESQTNPSQFSNALIIFLGDYCDKGPDTKRVIDFLVSLPSNYPNQKHVFLTGNHDFAFAAFIGVLPRPLDGSEFREGWKEIAESTEEIEGWYKGDGYEDMHLQGRRWGGSMTVKFNVAKGSDFKGSVNDARPTFESYGVPHGSPGLMKVVPDDHKKFLANMVWVHEEDNVGVETTEGLKKCKLIAVHGGLRQGIPIHEQLQLLKSKDTSISKVESLGGRKSTWYMPEELKGSSTLVVSGHHGKLHIEGLRLIIDECGGYEHKSMAAIILPSMKIVRDID